MPDVGIQIPPNLADWWPELVAAGATDLGGLSRERRPHLARASVPVARIRCASSSQPTGYALTERLCVYPQYIDAGVDRRRACSTSSRRSSGASSRGAGRAGTEAPFAIQPRSGRPGAIAKAPRRRVADARGADGDVRRDAAGGDRGHAPGGRRAARRARGRDRHVRRQPQHQRVERLHRRLRVLRLRAGQALPRRLRARRARLPSARARRRSTTARPSCASSRASTPTGSSRTTCTGCASPRTRPRDTAPTCTCTRTRRWRSRTCATSPACRRRRCSRGCATPAWARRPAPPPRSCTTGCASGSPRTSCPSRAGSRSSRRPTTPACARPPP